MDMAGFTARCPTCTYEHDFETEAEMDATYEKWLTRIARREGVAYPITEALKARFGNDQTFEDHHDLVAAALEYVGEYEHGSVNVEDVFARENPGPALQVMADVVFDFVGTVVMSRET